MWFPLQVTKMHGYLLTTGWYAFKYKTTNYGLFADIIEHFKSQVILKI